MINLTSDHVGRSFALIAGVSKYPNLPSDKQLPAAAVDVNALQVYLQKEEFFDEIVVLKDGDVTEERLKYFLEDYFAERVKRFPNSRFLFAYSGHGFSDGPKEYPNGHLLKSTARTLTDKENSINMTVLRTYFNEVADAGYQTLALINACDSGAFLSNRPFGEHDGQRRAGGIYFPTHGGEHAITAAGSTQMSWHIPKVGPGSVFFEKLIAGLGGQADTFPIYGDGSRGDGIITVDEIAAYLREEVALATSQMQIPIPADLAPNRSLGGFFFLNRQKMVDAGLVPPWPPKGGISFGVNTEETILKPSANSTEEPARNGPMPDERRGSTVGTVTVDSKENVPTLQRDPKEDEPKLRPGSDQNEMIAAGTIDTDQRDGQNYAWITPGTFDMGCALEDSDCDNDEKPAHVVTITKGFWLGQTPVTQAAYQRVMGANPSHFRGEQLPVESVTWLQARDYCEAVGARLPSEAEWEYAAWAGSKTVHFGELDTVAWYEKNSSDKTHKVGVKLPNAWNLYDMLGNVWEWVGDWYDEEYYKKSPVENPQGAGSGKYRVVRGGSWFSPSRNLRLSYRYSFGPSASFDYVGFRCARPA